MKMTINKPQSVRRSLSVRFERGDDDVWADLKDSLFSDTTYKPTSALVEFRQDDFALTLTRVMVFGTSGDTEPSSARNCSTVYTVETFSKLPQFVTNLVETARESLSLTIRGGEKAEPETSMPFDDKSRHAAYLAAMEWAIYHYIKEDGETLDDIKVKYGIDYTLEAWAAISVSNRENVHLLAEVNRLSTLAERQADELTRLNGLDEQNEQLRLALADTGGMSGAVRGEVVKMGVRAYSVLKSLDAALSNRELNREPVFYTEEVRDLIKGWNLLGTKK